MMAKFNKIDTINLIRTTGIVPVFYNADVEITKKVVKACYDGGIRAFEFTNRGDGAHKVFEAVLPFVLLTASVPGPLTVSVFPSAIEMPLFRVRVTVTSSPGLASAASPITVRLNSSTATVRIRKSFFI